jgi:hypothetical protein
MLAIPPVLPLYLKKPNLSEKDLKLAAVQQEKYLSEKNLSRTVTRTVTIAHFPEKKGSTQ